MLMILGIVLYSILLSTFFEKLLIKVIRKIRKILGFEFIKSIEEDETGIDFINVGTINNVYYGKQRHPVIICQKALLLDINIKRDKRIFMNIADWIVNNVFESNNYFLEYHYPYPIYNLDPPWRSGMAQGRALEVLAKAYTISKEKKYLICSRKIVKSLYIDYEDNGVTYKTENKGWWFEEFSSKESKRPHILNGMMFTIIGLIEYYKCTKDKDTKYLLDKGLLSLKINLPKYDRNGDSYYNSLGRRTGGDYHSLHIEQLEQIYKFTQEPVFKQFHDKWKNFGDQTFILRLIKKPDKTNIVIFLTNLIIASVVISVLKYFLHN